MIIIFNKDFFQLLPNKRKARKTHHQLTDISVKGPKE